MTPELKQALEKIKNACDERVDCGKHPKCPLYKPGEGCRVCLQAPEEWPVDEWAKEEDEQ